MRGTPFGGLGNPIPGIGSHHRRRQIEFLQHRAVAEIGAGLVLEIGAGFADLVALEAAAVDNAMMHDRIERIERRLHDEEAVAVSIAEGQPFLPVVAHAGPGDIAAAVAPGGIDVVEPERRRPGADGDIDKDLRVFLAEPAGDIEQRHEMGTDPVAGLVPLEGIDSALAHELKAAVLEPGLVGRLRQVEAAGFRDQPHLPGVGGPLVGAAITAERRDPDAEMRPHRIHFRLQAAEAFRKSPLVLYPQALAGIVPAIIDQIRLHRDSALLHQLGIKLGDDIEHGLLTDRESQIVPAVVMEEWRRGPGPFTLDVVEEATAQLPFGTDAGDGGEGIGGFFGDIEFALKANADAVRPDQIAAARHLETEETAAPGRRTTWAEANGGDPGHPDIGQFNAVQGNGLAIGLHGEGLADVVRAIAQFGAPQHPQPGAGMGEPSFDRLAAQTVCHPDSFGFRLDGVHGDGRGQLEILAGQIEDGIGAGPRRQHLFASGRGDIENGGLALAKADENEIAILPDQRQRRAPGHAGIGSLVDDAGEIGGAVRHHPLGGGRAVGGGGDAELAIGNLDGGAGPGRFPDGPAFAANLAAAGEGLHRQIGDRAGAGRAGIAVVDRFSLQVQLANPEQFRLAGKFAPRKTRHRHRHSRIFGGINLDGLGSQADADPAPGGFRKLFRLFRPQAEKRGSSLREFLARELVDQSLRHEPVVGDLPAHREHIVFQRCHPLFKGRLGRTWLRTGKINPGPGGQCGGTSQQGRHDPTAENKDGIHDQVSFHRGEQMFSGQTYLANRRE